MFDPAFGSFGATCIPESMPLGGSITPSLRCSRSLSVSPVEGNDGDCLGASASGFCIVEPGARSCAGAMRAVVTTIAATRVSAAITVPQSPKQLIVLAFLAVFAWIVMARCLAWMPDWSQRRFRKQGSPSHKNMTPFRAAICLAVYLWAAGQNTRRGPLIWEDALKQPFEQGA